MFLSVLTINIHKECFFYTACASVVNTFFICGSILGRKLMWPPIISRSQEKPRLGCGPKAKAHHLVLMSFSLVPFESCLLCFLVGQRSGANIRDICDRKKQQSAVIQKIIWICITSHVTPWGFTWRISVIVAYLFLCFVAWTPPPPL